MHIIPFTKTLFTLCITLTILIAGMIGSETIAAQAVTSSLLSTNTKQKAFLGTKRPEFSLPDISGKTRSTREWNGKVLIINFWASWCSPCRKEIPIFNKLQAEYGEDEIQFIGIAIDQRNAVKKFVDNTPIYYPNLIGNTTAVKLAKSYGNLTGSLPYSVFINRQGTISSIASGGLNEQYIRKTIEKLL